MKTTMKIFWITHLSLSTLCCFSQSGLVTEENLPCDTYPLLLDTKPDLPSPLNSKSGKEYVIAVNKDHKYALMEVTLSNDRKICPQLIIDSADFPTLATTGLHSEEELNTMKTITGRSLAEINELGRPLGLSHDGFMARDEDLISILKGDDMLVRQLGLTHPQLAKPLFHVLNMMDLDLSLNRWNMTIHQWDHIRYFFYHDQIVHVVAHDTKGGQESIFKDGIQGAFYIKLWREFTSDEIHYLKQEYGHLSENELTHFQQMLSEMNTGEMEPQYIMRYGFYEGHTYWRTDPVAISFIFGMKSLQELDALFEGNLYQILSHHYTE